MSPTTDTPVNSTRATPVEKGTAELKEVTADGVLSSNYDQVAGKVQREIRGRWDNNLRGEYDQFRKDPRFEGKTEDEIYKAFTEQKTRQLMEQLKRDPNFMQGIDHDDLAAAVSSKVAERLEGHREWMIRRAKPGSEFGYYNDLGENTKQQLQEHVLSLFKRNEPAPATETAPEPTTEQEIKRAAIIEKLKALPGMDLLTPEQQAQFIEKIADKLMDPASLTDPAKLSRDVKRAMKEVLGVAQGQRLDEEYEALVDGVVSAFDSSIDTLIKGKLEGDPVTNIMSLAAEWKKLTGKDLTEEDIKKFVDAHNGLEANKDKPITVEAMQAALMEFQGTLAEVMDSDQRAAAMEEAFEAKNRALYDQLAKLNENSSPEEIEAAATALMEARRAQREAEEQEVEAERNAPPTAEEWAQLKEYLNGNLFNQGVREKVGEFVKTQVASIDEQLKTDPENAELLAEREALLKYESEVNALLDRAYASYILQEKGQAAYDAFIAKSNADAEAQGLPPRFGADFEPITTIGEWSDVAQIGADVRASVGMQ